MAGWKSKRKTRSGTCSDRLDYVGTQDSFLRMQSISRVSGQKKFKKEITKQDSFTLLDGKEIKVPMMRQTDAFGYMEEADLQVLEMRTKVSPENGK